ncbi:MAG TPA: ribonuclease HII [Chitinophagaceae bacterium]|nr:ribonuclease HII [Chitinophagaceae bacterium]
MTRINGYEGTALNLDNLTFAGEAQFFTHYDTGMLSAYFRKGILEAGCDEAGRGCLAGPVFAAAVILPQDFYHPLLNDSKMLDEDTRYQLRPIIEKEAICYAVASVCNEEIDKINILKASFKAMHQAVDQLKQRPELLLIDGNRFTPYLGIAHQCFVKGDSKFAAISAASILAKTYRDDYMEALHEEHPEYLWQQNKGYPTPAHKRAIAANGLTKYHRLTFRSEL